MDENKFELFVNEILKLHQSFSDNWRETSNSKLINLKKARIHTMLNEKVFNKEFLEIVDEYHLLLNRQFSNLSEIQYDFESEIWEIRSRVKQKDSIINKLFHYSENQAGAGYPLNKCLNDIMGYRLMIDGIDITSDETQGLCEKIASKEGLRSYYQDKNGYQGIHFYFNNSNNFNFPWELQIWSKDNELDNERLHSDHKAKRSYISWPNDYNKAKAKERVKDL